MKKLIIMVFIAIVSINLYGGMGSTVSKFAIKKVVNKAVVYESKNIYDRKIYNLVNRYGDQVNKVFNRYGDGSINIVKRYGKTGIKNINIHGNEFINVEKKFPGLGLKIIETYGDNFAETVYKKSSKRVLIDIKSNKFIKKDISKYIKSPEEIEIYKNLKTKAVEVNGRPCLVRDDINVAIVDNNGITNLERMKNGLAPIDETGRPYNLHHIGQKMDSPFVELKESEHIGYSNIIHKNNIETQIDRSKYAIQRLIHWKEEAKRLER